MSMVYSPWTVVLCRRCASSRHCLPAVIRRVIAINIHASLTNNDSKNCRNLSLKCDMIRVSEFRVNAIRGTSGALD